MCNMSYFILKFPLRWINWSCSLALPLTIFSLSFSLKPFSPFCWTRNCGWTELWFPFSLDLLLCTSVVTPAFLYSRAFLCPYTVTVTVFSALTWLAMQSNGVCYNVQHNEWKVLLMQDSHSCVAVAAAWLHLMPWLHTEVQNLKQNS